MPTDKSLPDSDDIIDLTDLVEEGSTDGATSATDNPSDMSFEQELEDLFGDVEPAAAKPGPAGAKPGPAASATPDDDLIDLEGLELPGDELEKSPSPAKAAALVPDADDEIMDLAGLGFDEPEEPSTTPKAAPLGQADTDDDVMDLAGLDFDTPVEPSPPPKTAPAGDADAAGDTLDLSDLNFDVLDQPAPAGKPQAGPDLSDLDFDAPADASPPAPAPEEGPVDLEELSLPGLEEPTPGLADAAAMDALLGELPDEAQAPPAAADAPLDVSDLAGLPALEEPAAATPQPAPLPTPVPAPPAAVVAAAPVQAAPAIDLDALDKLITTAKGPEPEPEAPPADRLAGVASRLDILEAALSALADKLDERPEPPDHETMAQVLAERLDATLETRLGALRLELRPADGPPAVTTADLDALRTELAEAAGTALTGHEALVAELRQALGPDFDALRQSLPAPDAWVTPKGLAEALTGLRESLSVDLAAVLRTAKQAARDEAAAMGEALAARIEALENDRLDPAALAEQVRQALLPSLRDGETALETARQALAGLDERVTADDFQTAVEKLRAEVAEEILRSVPKAAAAVIREEITALAKAFED